MVRTGRIVGKLRYKEEERKLLTVADGHWRQRKLQW